MNTQERINIIKEVSKKIVLDISDKDVEETFKLIKKLHSNNECILYRENVKIILIISQENPIVFNHDFIQIIILVNVRIFQKINLIII